MPWFTHGKGYGSESTPPSICCSTNRATVIFHSYLLPRMSTVAKNCLGQTIDYLNYATGIGIRPRTPVTMCVVFFRFMATQFSATHVPWFGCSDRNII